MDFLQSFAAEIKNSVGKMIAKAKYDRTLKGQITEDLGSNKYKVKINGQEYDCTGICSLSVRDIVFVTAPQNDFSRLIAYKSRKTHNIFETLPSADGNYALTVSNGSYSWTKLN